MNRADRRAQARDIQRQLAAGGVDLAAAAPRRATLFLAWMYNEQGARPTGAWVSSLLACAARSAALGFQMRPRSCETGPMIAKARNMLLRSFLETEDEYLLFSDTDIAFAPEDVKLLLEADAPIAGALYFAAATSVEPWPVALERRDEEAEPGASTAPGLVPITLPEPPEDILEPDPADFQDTEVGQETLARVRAERAAKFAEWVSEATQPRRVDAVGAGLMLIRRDVAAALAEKYEGYPFEFVKDQGEDVTFCLRAAELGFETILVPKARVGHVKAVVL